MNRFIFLCFIYFVISHACCWKIAATPIQQQWQDGKNVKVQPFVGLLHSLMFFWMIHNSSVKGYRCRYFRHFFHQYMLFIIVDFMKERGWWCDCKNLCWWQSFVVVEDKRRQTRVISAPSSFTLSLDNVYLVLINQRAVIKITFTSDSHSFFIAEKEQ